MAATDTVTVQDIAKLLKLHDKNLKNLSDASKKKYKSSIKAQKQAIQDMVEGVTTKRDYAKAAQTLASTIEEVKSFEQQQAARADAGPSYPGPKLCGASGLKDTKVKDKINSIWHSGPGYKGTKGPKSLGSQVLHAHVTDKDAIAFYWRGEQMHVVGYGKKSGQAGAKDSGYKWET